MAVYGRTYRAYSGELTPEASRFLVLPRYHLAEIFRSRPFLALFAVAFAPCLVAATRIYLGYNAEAINVLRLPPELIERLLAITPSFFRNWVLMPQFVMAFLLTLVVGPALVSPDLRNNALPLYLARPIARREYVAGKLVVLLAVLSAVTWVPGLVLFLFQSFLAGWDWFADNYWLAASIFVGSAAWILTLSLIALAISAWVKWRPVAALLFLALPLIAQSMGTILNLLLRTELASVLQVWSVMGSLLGGLFRLDTANQSLHSWQAWTVLLLLWGASLWLLSRKVRAYEVEK